ncbi:hypothetical protein ACFE04_024135 [Oxalis oulophora]
MQTTTSFLLSLLLLLTLTTTKTTSHNVTKILSKHPDFSTFNHYLTLTHLSQEINQHTTITVLALDNTAMSTLLNQSSPSISTIKNILSVHVLLDYFGAKKLHQIRDGTALAATMYQATGSAPGTAGFVNITDLKGGKVGFGTQDAGEIGSYFVKSVEELPYNISVVQISKALKSDSAAAPTPEPSQLNVTGVMNAHGCKVFADTLLANAEAYNTYQNSLIALNVSEWNAYECSVVYGHILTSNLDNLEGGLTVFCPLDDPMKAFLPKFKNLTASQKVSLLEFFAVPIYQSMSMLKSNNGVMNTLATDGSNKFDFTVQNDGDAVMLETRNNKAKITGTLLDEQPVALYTIDKVLLPKELFKAAPAPAPAPEDAADSPKPSKSKSKSKDKSKKKKDEPDTPSDSPADSPDGDVADEDADSDSAGVRMAGAKFAAVFGLSMYLGSLLL